MNKPVDISPCIWYIIVKPNKGGIETEKKKSRTSPAAVKRYKEKNIRKFNFELNLKTDVDILEKLDSVPNKTGYVKTLIREDLKKE